MSALSRRTFVTGLSGLAMALVILGGSGWPALAQSLESLRASGALGERYDGLVTVRQASGEANRIAAEVNSQRQAIYRQRAAEQGVSADQVGRVYARQLFEQAPQGTWFLTEQGWVQK